MRFGLSGQKMAADDANKQNGARRGIGKNNRWLQSNPVVYEILHWPPPMASPEGKGIPAAPIGIPGPPSEGNVLFPMFGILRDSDNVRARERARASKCVRK